MPMRYLKIRLFRVFLRMLKPVLAERCSKSQTIQIIEKAKSNYPRCMDEVSTLGSFNVFGWVMVVNGWIAAFHRSMKEHGQTAEDTISVLYVFSDRFFMGIPLLVRRVIAWLFTSLPVFIFLRRQGEISQKRRNSDDFVFSVDKGPDGKLDLSLNFQECAVNKFYDKHEDLKDLKPYCNFFDIAYSRALGLGLDANETIGKGCSTCHLRYKKGRETLTPIAITGIIK